MSSNSHNADASATHHARNSEEAAALKGFIAIALLVVVAGVGLAATYGMAGVGALAIALTGAMLLLIVLVASGGE